MIINMNGGSSGGSGEGILAIFPLSFLKSFPISVTMGTKYSLSTAYYSDATPTSSTETKTYNVCGPIYGYSTSSYYHAYLVDKIPDCPNAVVASIYSKHDPIYPSDYPATQTQTMRTAVTKGDYERNDTWSNLSKIMELTYGLYQNYANSQNIPVGLSPCHVTLKYNSAELLYQIFGNRIIARYGSSSSYTGSYHTIEFDLDGYTISNFTMEQPDYSSLPNQYISNSSLTVYINVFIDSIVPL